MRRTDTQFLPDWCFSDGHPDWTEDQISGARVFMNNVLNDIQAGDVSYAQTRSLINSAIMVNGWDDIVKMQGVFAYMFNIFTAVVEGETNPRITP